MLNFFVNEIYLIYVVIIMKTVIVRFLVFLKIFLKILEIFDNIILIRFNKFLVFIVENILLRYVF